jgi:hypothetical protein
MPPTLSAPPPFIPPISRSSAFTPKLPYQPCSACIGFIHDFISLPPEVAGCFQIKRLQRIAPQLAHGLHRILSTLHSLDTYVIENTMRLRMDAEKKKGSDETTIGQVGSKALVAAILSRKGNEEISYLQTLLQDTAVFRDLYACQVWVEITLFNLWGAVKDIHLEHTGKKEGTAPPSLGLRAFYVFNNRPSVSNTQTKTEARPKLADTLPGFEFVDLYD